jgi:hypothetical protein
VQSFHADSLTPAKPQFEVSVASFAQCQSYDGSICAQLAGGDSPAVREYRITSTVELAIRPPAIIRSRCGMSLLICSSLSITVTMMGAFFEMERLRA